MSNPIKTNYWLNILYKKWNIDKYQPDKTINIKTAAKVTITLAVLKVKYL